MEGVKLVSKNYTSFNVEVESDEQRMDFLIGIPVRDVPSKLTMSGSEIH